MRDCITLKREYEFWIHRHYSSTCLFDEDLAKYMDLKVYFNHTDNNIGLRGF
ncbi:MAG: hypothetical protein IPN18_03540 [Ignavibacteriales bacterium]|nr:hypothetical protein [Ignavibacteriales bacterium]